MDDHADGEAEAAIERAHPFGVAASQVIVDGDEVDAAAREGVQRRGQSGDESLALAGFHFRDFAFVKDDPADQLHVEVAHVQKAPAGFADESKRRDNHGVERLLEEVFVGIIAGIGVFELLKDLRLQFSEAGLKVFVAEGFQLGLALIDGDDERLQFFDVALVLGADKERYDIVEELSYIHERFRRLPAAPSARKRTGPPAATGTNILLYLFGCASAKKRDTVVLIPKLPVFRLTWN